MSLPPFRLARPDTVDDALALLNDDSAAYCGGTELLLAMRTGLRQPGVLVDLKRIDALAGVRVEGRELVIGAVVTHQELAEHPRVRELVPVLADVEARIGNARVRAQGTIGGNLCFAEPRSDVATALVALGASVTIAGEHGGRTVPVAEFVLGPYYADLASDELLLDVRVPVPDAGTRAVYLKHQTLERPTVGVALVHAPGARRCRLVVGAVGDAPLAFDVAEPGDLNPAEVASAVDPTPDLGGSDRYKRHVTEVFVRRALSALAGGQGAS